MCGLNASSSPSSGPAVSVCTFHFKLPIHTQCFNYTYVVTSDPLIGSLSVPWRLLNRTCLLSYDAIPCFCEIGTSYFLAHFLQFSRVSTPIPLAIESSCSPALTLVILLTLSTSCMLSMPSVKKFLNLSLAWSADPTFKLINTTLDRQ